MTYTVYTAPQAANRAKQYVKWQSGYCLWFTKTMLCGPNQFAPGGSIYDANAAWVKATKKVTGGGFPPAGAPVYWGGGSHGHIAVSIGGGYVRSTDWPSKGAVGNVSIAQITRAWGLTYRGWSRDYAGLVIRGLEATSAPVVTPIPAPANYSEATAYTIDDELLRLGWRSPAAKTFNARVWSWLYWDGGAAGRAFCTTNYKEWMAESSSVFGPTSVKATNAMYKILDGGTPNYPYPGPKLLVRLGLRAD